MGKSKIIQNRIGIIGGSGLYNLDSISNKKLVEIDTPYGKPSDQVVTGEIGFVSVAFLARQTGTDSILPK